MAGDFEVNFTQYGLRAGGSAPFNGLTALTMAAWVKMESYPQYEGVISVTKSGTTNWAQLLAVTSSGHVYGGVNAGTTAASTVGATVVGTENWHYVVMRFDNAWSPQTVDVFVDGAEDNDPAYDAENEMVGTIDAADGSLMLARFNNAPNCLDGCLFDVALWSTALTDAEIVVLYNGGVPAPWAPWRVQGTALVGYWPLYEYTSGDLPTNLLDRGIAGNGLHLATVYTASHPQGITNPTFNAWARPGQRPWEYAWQLETV